MSDLHSSQQPRGTYLAKTVLGRTRGGDKALRASEDGKSQRDCYRLVDGRDQGHCRVCGKACDPYAVSMSDRAEHHHIDKRSQGGGHTTTNVCLVCRKCHDAIHVTATVRVEGDANQKLIILRRHPETGVWRAS